MQVQQVQVRPASIERYRAVVGAERVEEVLRVAEQIRRRMGRRVVWNVNSTAVGGGVAELLRFLLAYARGLGVDARWLVIRGPLAFFQLTKRLHHALHGAPGSVPPHEDERQLYEQVLAENARELIELVAPDDVVILHDPQTAGLIPILVQHGARVIWRCHIGHDRHADGVDQGWRFLAPYLEPAHAMVFSRAAFIPAYLAHKRPVIIPPSIDPFSPKNESLPFGAVRSILVNAGLLEGPPGDAPPAFSREDGTSGLVTRGADVLRLGRAPTWDTPLVVQVSRWDRLKDPVGVLEGFSRLVDPQAPAAAELVLAGPNVRAVADDPEGASVFEEVITAWRHLDHERRRRVHLASLPTTDVEENAAIVNALQRHAAVVVQKSLREGFGLTVAEAMWKGRAVVASGVGGIQDQISDGQTGLLLEDPSDLGAFADALARVLRDPELARRLGANAQERVRERYLGLRSLLQYAALIEQVEGGAVLPVPHPMPLVPYPQAP